MPPDALWDSQIEENPRIAMDVVNPITKFVINPVDQIFCNSFGLFRAKALP